MPERRQHVLDLAVLEAGDEYPTLPRTLRAGLSSDVTDPSSPTDRLTASKPTPTPMTAVTRLRGKR